MKDMRVQDVMTHFFVAFKPEDSIHDAARRLAHNHISGAPVVHDKKCIGVISESDILRAALPPHREGRLYTIIEFLSELSRDASHQRLHTVTVGDVMSSPPITVRSHASVWKAATLMERHNVKRLPVIDESGFLRGIISRADLVRVLGRTDDAIRNDVLEALEVLGEESLGDPVVLVGDGVLTIRGKVDRRSTKRLALELARRTPGVIEIIDELEFETDDRSPGGVNGDPWATGPLVRSG